MTVVAPPPARDGDPRRFQIQSLLNAPAGQRLRNGREVVAVNIASGAYRSSCTIEDVEIVFADGEAALAVLKDLGVGALLSDAARVKPAFLLDSRREIETYRNVLEPFGIGAPRMLGAAADDASRCYLLLLDVAPGVPLWQVGEAEAWHGAARWIAAMHAGFGGTARPSAGPARLLRYDEDYYHRWHRRAESTLASGGERQDASRLLRAYEAVIPRLLELPQTFIHGEFHASNILAQCRRGSFGITPVDWEMAAVGPGLMDLADLTAGKWAPGQREGMAGAYRDALAAHGAPAQPGFDRALDYCRLHRCVQWLSWSADWSPPREHAQDWFGEALRVCGSLGIAD